MSFYQDHKLEIKLVLASLALVHLPLLSSTYWGTPFWGSPLDPANAGVFGDFVGGYIGTIFLVISVVVLAASFRDQKKTNERTTFEARFFELLRYHRENVSEIEVGTLKSRRAFVSFIREWRLILSVVKGACAKVGSDLSVEQKARLSFMAFFYGVDEVLTPMLKNAVAKETYPVNLVDELIRQLENDKENYRRLRDEHPGSDNTVYSMSSGPTKGINIRFRAYIPFDGHQSHLDHYFRHLGHILKYIAARSSGREVQDHADLVRAQMTTHEQALLALYAVSIDGAWRTQDYVRTYHMTKNIPSKFFADDEFNN